MNIKKKVGIFSFVLVTVSGKFVDTINNINVTSENGGNI